MDSKGAPFLYASVEPFFASVVLMFRWQWTGLRWCSVVHWRQRRNHKQFGRRQRKRTERKWRVDPARPDWEPEDKIHEGARTVSDSLIYLWCFANLKNDKPKTFLINHFCLQTEDLATSSSIKLRVRICSVCLGDFRWQFQSNECSHMKVAGIWRRADEELTLSIFLQWRGRWNSWVRLLRNNCSRRYACTCALQKSLLVVILSCTRASHYSRNIFKSHVAGCYGVSETQSVCSTVSSASTEPWFCDACKAGVKPASLNYSSIWKKKTLWCVVPASLMPSVGKLFAFSIASCVQILVESTRKPMLASECRSFWVYQQWVWTSLQMVAKSEIVRLL